MPRDAAARRARPGLQDRAWRRSTSSARRSAPRRSASRAARSTRRSRAPAARQLFGGPLAELQMIQAQARRHGARRSMPRRCSSIAPPGPRTSGAERITREAAMAKLYATEAAQRVIDDAVQLHGGARRRRRPPGRAALSRDPRAAHLRGRLGGAEARHRAPDARRARQGASAELADQGGSASGYVKERTMSADTAHLDTFARDHLPPRELWPELSFDLPELQYPARLNCAAELLDRAVERGPRRPGRVLHAERALDLPRAARAREPDRARAARATSASCRATACCCARPTTRCWSPAGSPCSRPAASRSRTMPLLRARELATIVDKAADHARAVRRAPRRRAGAGARRRRVRRSLLLHGSGEPAPTPSSKRACGATRPTSTTSTPRPTTSR